MTYEKPYVINTGTDDFNKKFYYCHRRGFPNVPVFGSIGCYQKAKSVCDMYNGVEKKTERKEKR